MKRSGAFRAGLTLASIAFTAAVGLLAALDTAVAGDGPAVPVVWWVDYALFASAVLLVQDVIPRPRALGRTPLLCALVVLAAGLVLLFAEQATTALLFVLSATLAAFFWPPGAVVGVIAAQTAVVAVAGVWGASSVAERVVEVIVFAFSQAFGALVVFVARSEERARQELAVAHADLRATTALLEASTKESERLRIARDLHDQTGHHLAALSIELEVATHLTSSDAALEHVRRARSIATDLLSTVRSTVHDLRTEPPSLAAALEGLADAIPRMAVTVEVPAEPGASLEQSAAILRCVQEALTNALRHSDAKTVRIRVDADDDEFSVEVADDGTGVAHIEPGNGLHGMRERIELLGGRLDLASSPGRGFTVTARLPRRAPSSRQ